MSWSKTCDACVRLIKRLSSHEEVTRCRGCTRVLCPRCHASHDLHDDESPKHIRYDAACPCRGCACDNKARALAIAEVEAESTFTSETLPAPPTMPVKKKPFYTEKEKQQRATDAVKQMEEEERQEEERRAKLGAQRSDAFHKELNALVKRPETLHRISEAERNRLAERHKGKVPLRVDYVDPDRLQLWQIIEDTLAKEFGTKNVACHDVIEEAFVKHTNPNEVPLITFTGDDFLTLRFRKHSVLDLFHRHTVPFWEKREFPPVVLRTLQVTCEQALQSDELKTSQSQREHLLKIGVPDSIVSGLDTILAWLMEESKRVIDTTQYAELIRRGLAKETIDSLIEVVKPVWENGEINKIETPILFKSVIPTESISVVKDVYGPIASLRFTFPANSSNAEAHQMISHLSKLLLVLRTKARGKDEKTNVVEYWYSIDTNTGIYQLFFRWNTVTDFVRQFERYPIAPFELKVDTYADRVGQVLAQNKK